MFLNSGLLSAPGAPSLTLTGAAFALGLAVGTTMSSTGTAPSPAAIVPPPDAAQAEPWSSLKHAAHPAEVLRVLDGDTFEARVHVPGIDITTKVRLRGIDAPELKARCPEERIKAEAARNTLAMLLAEGGVEISRVGLDKFGGRVDADASTKSTPAISAALLRAGVARNYAGGRRETWCGS